MFEDLKKALEFIEAIADKAMPKETSPPDSFAAAFKEASSEADEKED